MIEKDKKRIKEKKDLIIKFFPFVNWRLKVSLVKGISKPIRIKKDFFNNYKQRIIGIIFVLLISSVLVFFFYKDRIVMGLSYDWVQTDWVGGESASYPRHDNYQTGWTYYSSKTNDINVSVSGQATINATTTIPAMTAVLPTAKKEAPAVYDSTSSMYIIGGFYLDGSNDPHYLTEIVKYVPSTDTATTSNIGVLPKQLRGHSADLNTSDGKIYIFGGYNNTDGEFNANIYSFDPASPSSNAVDTTYDLPVGMEYGPAVYAPNVSKFYIFGGFYLDGSNNSVYLDTIVEFNSSTGDVATTSTGLPHALKGASAEYYPVDGKIYIFGGYDSDDGAYSNKIYSFDPTSPSSGASDTGYTMPSARAYTDAVYYSSFNDSIRKIYVIGGYRLSGDTSTYLNEVISFGGSSNATAINRSLSKNLKAAGAAFDSDNKIIYIFGGYDGNGLAFSDSIYKLQFHFGPLTSSAYNTTDPTTVLSTIDWGESLAAATDIVFHVRTATNDDNSTPADVTDDTPDTWTDWCGPDNGGAGCDIDTYFGTSTQAVDDMFQDASDDHWIQYRAYLLTESMDTTPTLQDVTMTYVVNTEPTVSSVTASQGSDGDVDVGYDLADSEESTTTIYLLYDLGITLDGDITANATSVDVSDASNLASSGTIQIDSEHLTYTGKSTNTLTGVTRGANNTNFYKTSHSNGAAIWIKANTLSGDSGSVGVGNGKAIVWTPKTDIDGFYAASTVKVKVTANDGNAARQIHSADSSVFEFDTTDPVAGTPTGGGTGININGNATTSLGNQKTNTTSVTLNLSCTDDTALEYIASNDGVFDSETYSNYSASEAWTLADYCADQEYGCVRTVYLKFKDAYANEIGTYTDTVTLDNNPPAIPSNVYIQDVSDPDVAYRLFITWDRNTESDWIKYEVYRSTNGVDFSLYSTITDSSINYIIDDESGSGLTQGQIYYYKVRSYDDITNISEFSSTVNMTAGGNPNDEVAPEISNVAPGTPTINSVTITWSTDEVATSNIIYSTDSAVPGGSDSQGVSGYYSSHSVTVVNLNPSTTYYFKAYSCDPSGNCTNSSISQFDTQASDDDPPDISNIQTSNINGTSATITWDTDELADSFVEYSEQSGFSSGDVQGVYTLSTSHSVILRGLSTGTTYYYKVRSSDASGNESVSSESSFATSDPSSDVTAPVISNVSVSNIAYNTARVTWTTDENSSSFVEFGLDTNYGRIYGQDDSVTSHTVDLPKDLSAATAYHYRVRSMDQLGNEGFSSDDTFTTAASPNDTTAPTISNVQLGEPGLTIITITWDTDEDADSYIGYSQDTSYSLEQGSPTMTDSHSVTLVGLQPGTTYYSRIKSTDPSGNIQIDNNSGSGYQFTTESSGASLPVISNVQITGTDHDSTNITWTTDKSSTSFVEYGFDTSYGNSQGYYTMVTSHSVELKGLLSDATYHFRVRSTDADSLEAVSQDYTFTTEAAPDITPPVISNIQTENINLTSADITWTTNEAANALVDYGTATSSLSHIAGDATTYETSHSVSLSSLTAGTTYYYRVRSQDQAGNWTTDDNSGSYYSFLTTADTTAPTISNVTTAIISNTGAVITWDTSEDSTSQVFYGATTSYGSQTTEDSTLTQTHSVTISGLNPGTTYYYKVRSVDGAGNPAEDDDSGSSYNFQTTEASTIGGGGGGGSSGPEIDVIPPDIYDVEVVNLTYTSAKIRWKTDETATGIIEYGLTGDYGNLSGTYEIEGLLHQVILENLQPGTVYHYVVSSTDESGNLSKTSDDVFRTVSLTEKIEELEEELEEVEEEEEKEEIEEEIAGLKELLLQIEGFSNQEALLKISETVKETAEKKLDPPVIAGDLPEIEVFEDSARISWTTDIEANSVVAYADEYQYDPDKEEPYENIVGNMDEYVKYHLVEITGLSPATLYHLQVRSRGEIGPEAKSQDLTFFTKSVLPEISNFRVTSVTNEQIEIFWETNVPTDVIVEYTDLQTAKTLAQGDPSFVKKHEFVLENLLPDTTYSARLICKDELGNEVRGDKFQFSTGKDDIAPVIRQVRADSTLYPGKEVKIQTIITWQTDELSTSQVFWQEGIGKGAPVISVPMDKVLVNKHVIVTTKFKPSTVYKFWVESEDAAGNKATSREFTILTPKRTETVLEIIIKNFEDIFSWTNRLR